MSVSFKSSAPVYLRRIGLVAAILLLVALWTLADFDQWLRATLVWIDNRGIAAPVIFIALYIVVTVVMIPPSIFTIGAGIVFDLLPAAGYVFVGANLGAVAAFLVGRHLARDWVMKKIEGRDRIHAVAGAIEDQGWKVVLLTRLSPLFPFNLQNYVYGITDISLRSYVTGTLIGMIPGIFMYTYVGSVIGELALVGAGQRDLTAWEWALYAVGLAATVLVTISITRQARRKLERQVDV